MVREDRTGRGRRKDESRESKAPSGEHRANSVLVELLLLRGVRWRGGGLLPDGGDGIRHRKYRIHGRSRELTAFLDREPTILQKRLCGIHCREKCKEHRAGLLQGRRQNR